MNGRKLYDKIYLKEIKLNQLIINESHNRFRRQQ